MAPFAGQLDGDNNLEVVAALQVGIVHVWDAVTNGLMWERHLDAQFFRSTATVGDVDGDGYQEIIMVSDTFWGSSDYPGGTYCLNAQNGMQEWVFRGAFGATSPKVIDLDGDGALEIVCASSSKVFALNHDGSLLWQTDTGPGRSAPTIIPDVNGDGHPDVVHQATGGGLYCYSGMDGSLIWQNSSVGSVYETYDINWHGTAAADLDGDGTWEIIAVDASSNLWCVDAVSEATEWSANTGASTGIHVAPSLFDIDGDGFVEIAVGGCCDQPEPLRVYNHDGSLLWQISFGNAHDMHDPANDDVDEDGCGELLVGTFDGSTNHNSVFVLDDGSATNCGLLRQETPAPFPKPEIRFAGNALRLLFPYSSQAALKIYDPAGRLSATLFNGYLSAGLHEFSLPKLPAGAYRAVLEYPGGSVSQGLVVK